MTGEDCSELCGRRERRVDWRTNDWMCIFIVASILKAEMPSRLRRPRFVYITATLSSIYIACVCIDNFEILEAKTKWETCRNMAIKNVTLWTFAGVHLQEEIIGHPISLWKCPHFQGSNWFLMCASNLNWRCRALVFIAVDQRRLDFIWSSVLVSGRLTSLFYTVSIVSVSAFFVCIFRWCRICLLSEKKRTSVYRLHRYAIARI